jgi:drug/metabolite transporter superfamily protein YnfA
MTPATPFLFLAAALFEVGGDALVRKGLRGGGFPIGALGFCVLGCYGILVNLVPLDFSKLLGAYVAVFAVVSVLYGRMLFGERPTASTWLGLAIIAVGSAVLQYGQSAR